MKKLFALTLAAALALSLTACGGGEDSSKSNPGSNSNPGSSSEAPSAGGSNAGGSEADPDASEPEPAAQLTAANIGEKVSLDFVEFTLDDFGHGENIKEGGSTLSWGIADGCEAYWLHGTLTNLGGEAADLNNAYVKIIFDDTYTYEGSIMMFGGRDAAPLADTSIYLCADVPPKAFENAQKVVVQLGFNEGFAEYDWSKGDRTMEAFDYAYEFVHDATAA